MSRECRHYGKEDTVATKDEWKSTGKELGGAFKGLAATMIRTAKAGIERAEDWAEAQKDDQDQAAEETAGRAAEAAEEPNDAFNDGSWRETGKNLGRALMSLGATLTNTVEEGAEKAEKWADENGPKVEEAVEKAAAKAEQAAENIQKDAADFAEGLKEGTAKASETVDAEVVSEEILKESETENR